MWRFDLRQQSEPPNELCHLFLKGSPPSTGQRRLEDPPTCNDSNFLLCLSILDISSGFHLNVQQLTI
jgi:hypothetical protein